MQEGTMQDVFPFLLMVHFYEKKKVTVRNLLFSFMKF